MPTKRLKELRIALADASYWTQRAAAFALGLAWDEWDKLQIRRALRCGSAEPRATESRQPEITFAEFRRMTGQDPDLGVSPCPCASCCDARRRTVA